jgi:hypothetical protein
MASSVCVILAKKEKHWHVKRSRMKFVMFYFS